MEEVDLYNINLQEFFDEYLCRDNVDVLLRRVIQESPSQKHNRIYQAIANKINLPIDDILRQVSAITRELHSQKSPLEVFEAGVLNIDDFLKKEYPSHDYYIKPLLQPGSLVEIYGSTGIGKTFLRESIAIAVTHGVNIGPWEVEKTAGVLIIDGEMPVQSLQTRLHMLSGGLPERKESFALISSTSLLSDGYQAPNMTTFSWRQALLQYLENHPEYKILMLDNIVSLFPGLDENSAKDWSPSNQWLLQLRAMGLAVIKFQHPTKRGKSARGTALHGDNMDCIIRLERPKKYYKSRGAMFEVHFEKGRDLSGSQLDAFIFRIVPDPSRPDMLTWKTEKISKQDSAEEKPNENIMTIITMLDKGTKQTGIAEKIGCKPQYVSSVKQKAIKDGIIDKKGHLTDKGKQFYGETDVNESGEDDE